MRYSTTKRFDRFGDDRLTAITDDHRRRGEPEKSGSNMPYHWHSTLLDLGQFVRTCSPRESASWSHRIVEFAIVPRRVAGDILHRSLEVAHCIFELPDIVLELRTHFRCQHQIFLSLFLERLYFSAKPRTLPLGIL